MKRECNVMYAGKSLILLRKQRSIDIMSMQMHQEGKESIRREFKVKSQLGYKLIANTILCHLIDLLNRLKPKNNLMD